MSNFKTLELFMSSSFTNEAIQFILKRDDLDMQEDELLKFIKKDYNIELEDLRLNQIKNESVMDLLWQEYGSVNKYILEDVLRKNLDPSYLSKYGINWIRYSNINHISKILKTYNMPILEKMFGCSFRLELIFSASRLDHNLSAKDLYDVCEGKSSLLIISKGCRTGHIFGAYNDGFWVNGTMRIENSFLLKMSIHETGTWHISKPVNTNTHYDNANLTSVLVFGNKDLILDGYIWRYNVRSYDNVFATNKWNIDIIEVYRIQKQD